MLGRLYSWVMIFSSGAATSSDAHLTYAGSFKLGLMFYYDDVEIVNPLPHAGNISLSQWYGRFLDGSTSSTSDDVSGLS
jgi:hypothetical protein